MPQLIGGQIDALFGDGPIIAPQVNSGRMVALAVAGPTRRVLERLADERALRPGDSVTPTAAALLYTWYRAGWIALADNETEERYG
jgi:hypothetical protein